VFSGDGAACLVDFALASPVAEIRPEFTHHAQIVGTLAYLAPEQTGRTSRPVDQRADLYALGATLYELATGEPPFGSGDPLQLVHDHLARVPASPVGRIIRGALSPLGACADPVGHGPRHSGSACTARGPRRGDAAEHPAS
jgi:serine/threonine protein kinase